MIPQISDILSPKRLRRLRYLFDVILKTLTFAFTCSTIIRSLPLRRFAAFASPPSSSPRGFFAGVSLFACSPAMP